jgi:TPR repeat protein
VISYLHWQLLTRLVIGHNWLLRAQRSLANVCRAERGSSSGSGSSATTPGNDHEVISARAYAEAEQRLHTADYVEARGILVPAIEYLQRAVDAAHAQGNVQGPLLSTVHGFFLLDDQTNSMQAAEAYMSLGNVTSSRSNDRYFQQAMAYLREAAELGDYRLPAHLEQ